MIIAISVKDADRQRGICGSSLIGLGVLVAVLGPSIGCHKQGEEYFPIGPTGAQSNYTIQYIAPLVGLQKAQMTLRWEGTKEIDGKQYYRRVVAYSGLPGATSDVSYCRRAPSGIYCIPDGLGEASEYLEEPSPVTVGTAWTSKTADSTADYKAESITTVELFDRKYEKCL